VSGKVLKARNRPKARPVKQSAITKRVILKEIRPYFFFSLERCGFQWGRRSSAKWEAKAKGKDRAGFSDYRQLLRRLKRGQVPAW